MTATTTPTPPEVPDLPTATAWLDRAERRVRRALAELRVAGIDVQSEQDDLGELAIAGQHPADVATETLEREVDLGLMQDFERELDEIIAARERVAAGRYGTCERCHATVQMERLEAVPATRFCRPCAEQAEHVVALHGRPGRRTVLVSDEFLARDDRTGDGDDDRSAEEIAVHVERSPG